MSSPYPSGVYKDNNTTTPDYLGCSDSINITDYSSMYNEDFQNTISSYTPEVIRDSEYDTIDSLLSERISQLDGVSNFITECYNVNSYDEDMTYKLTSLFDIDYPLNYGSDRLKLLAENYTKIRKVRGKEVAIYMLLRILERSEQELYENDTDDTTITKNSDNSWTIRNTRIVDTEFATYMLKKVIQTGLKFTFTN